MKRLTYLLLLFVFLILSCGPNAQEKAAMQQHRDDSIANAAAMAAKQKMQEQNDLRNSLNSLKTDLENAKADLDVANDEMNKIKEFHIGRAESERDEQIRNQDLKIQALRDKIENLNQQIRETQQKLSLLQ